jgi:hypothetical protein
VVCRNAANAQAHEIARALLKRGARWADVKGLVASCDEEPETVRRIVLGYMSKVVLGSGDSRAAQIIEEFSGHWYDCGKAGLVLACYRLCAGK